MSVEFAQHVFNFYSTHFARHDIQTSSEKEFQSLRNQASLVTKSHRASQILLYSPFVLTIAGVVLWGIYRSHSLSTLTWFGVLFAQLAMFSIGGYWFDSRYWSMIMGTAEAFEEPHDRFFNEVGEVSRWIFDGIHFVGQQAERDLHYPTLAIHLGALAAIYYFSIIPSITGAAFLSPLGIYFLIVTNYLLFFTIQAGWTLFVAFYFLVYRIPQNLRDDDQFNPSLEVLQYNNRLGFGPFFNFLTTGVTISTMNLIVLVAVFNLLEIQAFISNVIISLQALVSVIPFFGFQYGIHVLILQRKQKQLQELRTGFEGSLDPWFSEGVPDWNGDSLDAYLLLEFKRELERAPEWPSDIFLGIQIVATALIPPLLNFTISEFF